MDDATLNALSEQMLVHWNKMVSDCADDMRAIVAIYGRQNEIPVKDRTGILFAVGEQHFLITAAHDLLEFHKAQISLYTAPVVAGDPPVPLSVHIFGNTETDVAVMLLSPEIVKQLVPRRRFLRITDLDLGAEAVGGFYVVRGFPNAFSEVDIQKRNVVTKPLAYAAVPFRGTADTQLGFDPTINILLQHPESGLDAAGNKIKSPKLGGMSGGAIFRLARVDQDRAATWTPDKRKLVAVQVSAKYGEFIKGTWIRIAVGLICENFPSCREALQITL